MASNWNAFDKTPSKLLVEIKNLAELRGFDVATCAAVAQLHMYQVHCTVPGRNRDVVDFKYRREILMEDCEILGGVLRIGTENDIQLGPLDNVGVNGPYGGLFG